MNFRFSGYGISDIGLTRDGNEDSGLVSSFCIAVADGMGGHAGGEIASKIAIQKLNSALTLLENQDLDSESKSDFFLDLINQIDNEILNQSNLNYSDLAYDKLLCSDRKLLTCYPYITKQATGFSDIEGQNIDYNLYMSNTEKKIYEKLYDLISKK